MKIALVILALFSIQSFASSAPSTERLLGACADEAKTCSLKIYDSFPDVVVSVDGSPQDMVYLEASECNLPNSQYLATAVMIASPNGKVLDSVSNFVTLYPFSDTFGTDHRLQAPTGEILTWMNKWNWRIRYSQGNYLRLICNIPDDTL